ncbi:hypothetical protein [Nonomuraea angiospora]
MAVALPLTAVALFDAGPARMGLLNAAGYLPALLFTCWRACGSTAAAAGHCSSEPTWGEPSRSA